MSEDEPESFPPSSELPEPPLPEDELLELIELDIEEELVIKLELSELLATELEELDGKDELGILLDELEPLSEPELLEGTELSLVGGLVLDELLDDVVLVLELDEGLELLDEGCSSLADDSEDSGCEDSTSAWLELEELDSLEELDDASPVKQYVHSLRHVSSSQFGLLGQTQESLELDDDSELEHPCSGVEEDSPKSFAKTV